MPVYAPAIPMGLLKCMHATEKGSSRAQRGSVAL